EALLPGRAPPTGTGHLLPPPARDGGAAARADAAPRALHAARTAALPVRDPGAPPAGRTRRLPGRRASRRRTRRTGRPADPPPPAARSSGGLTDVEPVVVFAGGWGGLPAAVVGARGVSIRFLRCGRTGTFGVQNPGRGSTMEELDFASVFEAQPTATAVLSPDLVIRAVNRAYEEMTGHGRGAVVGRHLFELPGASSSGPELRASLERVLADGVTDIIALARYALEKPGEPGTLEERHWSVVNAPVPDADGGVGLIVQRIEEITPFLDRSREQILSSAGSTAERVRQIEVELLARAQDLQKVNQRLRVTQDHQRRTVQILQRQIESHREALADTSHDLKHPITGLQLRLEEALADLDTDPDDDLRQMLLAALHDAEH